MLHISFWKSLLFLLFLTNAGYFALSASAQRVPQKACTGINLSVWHKWATQNPDHAHCTCFNLGIQSTMHRLNGPGINLLGSHVRTHAYGLQLSGLFNLTRGQMKGLQVSALTNINGNDLTGFSLSGLVNISGHQTRGICVSGLAGIAGDQTRGIIASGLIALNGKDVRGVSLSGLANICESGQGISVSGLLNVAAQNASGLQLSGLGNITAGRMTGVQIGMANIAVRAKGLQIGIINYYQEQLDGFQLGLINANRHTRVQLMLSGGTATKFNIGARFKNKPFYTILGAGTHYLEPGQPFSVSASYRAGLAYPICSLFSIGGDLGFTHIETFKNKPRNNVPARLYALQARISIECQLTQKFSLFAAGGYEHARWYTRDCTYRKGLMAEAGIILF